MYGELEWGMSSVKLSSQCSYVIHHHRDTSHQVHDLVRFMSSDVAIFGTVFE